MPKDINRAITDSVSLSQHADTKLNNILFLEKEARQLTVSKADNYRLIQLNKKITQSIGEASHTINTAKRTIQLVLHEGPNHPKRELLEKKLAHLELQSRRLDNLRERALARISPSTADPLHEALKSAPKPSNIDPMMNAKINRLLANVFDSNGLVNDKSIQPAMQNLNAEEKRFFLNELSQKMLSGEHTHLNIEKVLQQLPMASKAEERQMFAEELQKANKARNYEILVQTHAPTTRLPTTKRSHDDNLFVTPEQNKIDDALRQQVKEALAGGFAKVKEILSHLPAEKRMDFIVAVREESDRRNTERAFSEVNVPKEPVQRGPRR